MLSSLEAAVLAESCGLDLAGDEVGHDEGSEVGPRGA